MILILLYQCLAGFLAWWNYILIKNNRKIYHTVNGSLHIAAALTIGYYTEWNYGVSCLLFTRVVFDFVLNVLRHKGVGYVSPAPESKVDKVEKWIVLKIAGIGKVFITEERVEWTAIFFRIGILLLATGFLFV